MASFLWASSSCSRKLKQQTGAISLGPHCYSLSLPYTWFDCLLEHNEEVRMKPHIGNMVDAPQVVLPVVNSSVTNKDI